jgi:hypothetical protein
MQEGGASMEEMEEKATSKSWKTKRLPSERAPLKLERSFTAAEWAAIRRGSIPEAMEDHWFIYESRGWLSFHRSWTGFCIFRVRFRKRGTGMEIVEAWVNRSMNQYSFLDDTYNAALVSWLIDAPLLKRDAEFPKLAWPRDPA